MPRPRQPRVVAATVASLLIGVLGSTSASAHRADPAPIERPAPTVERVAGGRDLQTRGRVDVERVGRDIRQGVASDDGPDIAADPASTSTTPPPTLVKLPTLNGGSDPMVAVGPDHVVRSDEQRLVITDRSGAGATVVTMADLFLLPDGAEQSDGRVWFDPRHQRWIAIEVSHDCTPGGGATYGHGTLDIAVSDTADPRAPWSVYFFGYDDAWPLVPGFGNSTDKYVLTSYVAPLTVDCQTLGGIHDVTALDIPDLLGGGETDAEYFTYEDEDSVRRYGTFHPVIQQPATSATVYLTGTTSEGPSSEIHQWLYRLTGTGAATTISDADDLDGSGIIAPWADARSVQQGGLEYTPSAFTTSAAWRAGRLAMARTEACTPTGDSAPRNCVRVTELLTAGATPALRQEFFLGTSGLETYHGSLAYSIDGELLISYGQSAVLTGLSSFVVRQRPTDAVNTVSAPVSLQAATGLFTPNQSQAASQWVGAAPDPLVPDAVWLTNSNGSTSGTPLIGTAQARTADGSTFTPITPLRVLDTRDGTGLGGRFTSGTPRTFQVAGVGTIPTNAIAVTANVTVTGQTASGYVSITPTATATPTSSTLNFPSGDTRANNVTVSLDTTGKLAAVYKSGAGRTTHLIVDVTGFFVAGDGAATYQPVTPVRLLDSRVGNGVPAAFAANTPRTVQITGRGGIPANDVVAITGNLTVTGQTRSGYVSVTPDPTATPSTSTINFPTGESRANGLTVPVSATGRIAAVFKASSGSAHLILDVTGYYTSDDGGLRFYPLEPGRILDTRSTTLTMLTGKFTSSTARTLVTGGHFGVPGNALAVTGNLTITGQSKGGYVSVTKSKTSTPSVSTINFPVGDTRANGITVPLDANNDQHLVFKSSSGATTHVILDLTGYFR